MAKVKLMFLVAIGLIANPNIFGQITSSTSPTQAEIYAGSADRNQRVFGDTDENGMIRQPPKDEGNYEFFKGYRNKIRKENADKMSAAIANVEEIGKRFTAPQEYLDKYPEYSKAKNLGIFRLYPDIKCGSGETVDVAELERCGHLPQVTGFGSKISFRLQEFPLHLAPGINYFFASYDLHFADQNLNTGSNGMESLIAEIGTGDLENIKSDSKGVEFLTKWKKSRSRTDFTAHKKIIEKGIADGGYQYSSAVPAKLDAVYALRSISYYQNKKNFMHTDLLIAFKIVGREKDGSLIIIWKQLRKNDDTFIRN